ncbi:MAG: PQQ-dependent sugar dehydrogenase [Planctomycetaceae bacterium]
MLRFRLTRLMLAAMCAAMVVCFVGLQQVPADTTSAEIEAYREFAMAHLGDPERGRRLFEEHETLSCTACHRITGLEKSGPNLDGIGDKFTRTELIRQVLEPSAEIKPGYEQTVVVTSDGVTLAGRVERATKLEVRLIDAKGRQTNFARDDIDELHVSLKSLMPDNIVTTVSKEQFADIIAYMQTLKFGVKTGLAAGGRAVDIPRLTKPVRFIPASSDAVRFENPVYCNSIPGLPGQLMVVEHALARVWRLIPDTDNPRKELFLDLSDEVHVSPNQGIMCLAFHPRFEENGRYFLEYEVEEAGQVRTTIAERKASADRLSDSGQPSIRLLEVDQPAYNHNGGCLTFGPDGMLYAAFGDGGPQEDPPGNSQNPKVLLGSMIRINVDEADGARAYSIPPDNPFLAAHQADPAVRPETWAIGFREPWRFTFDSLTGDLWLGDVGQNKFEEISLVKRGENHGWNVREAFAPFSDEYRREGETYTEPLFAYEHGLGFSATGGYVYRARRDSSFYGVYIFGDYNTRRVWGLRQRGGELLDVKELGTAPGGIASFGLDDRAELLLVTYDGGIFHVDLSEAEYE